MVQNRRGQILTEAVLGICLFCSFFGFSVWYFCREYRRLICEKELFEVTRSAANEPDRKKAPSGSGGPGAGKLDGLGANGKGPRMRFVSAVSITRKPDGVEGSLFCEGEILRLSVKKLPQWK